MVYNASYLVDGNIAITKSMELKNHDRLRENQFWFTYASFTKFSFSVDSLATYHRILIPFHTIV